MQNRRKTDSNRGGALLSVIIAMTVVGILGSLVLSVSYTNFRMKQVNKKSTDNFYSAESVLDEIFVGLQMEVSEQYKSAYTIMMENYGAYVTTENMEEVMTAHFNTEFVFRMVEVLQADPSDKDHYSLEAIDNYVVKSHFPTGDECVISSTDNRLETLTDGLILRNIQVSYTSKGYVNTITTDIKITIPELQFAKISNMPTTNDYCLIAEGGINANSNSYWDLQGKAFAGNDIHLFSGASFTATNPAASLLISKENISLDNNARFQSKASLWAKNIELVGSYATANLLGRTYVKDDTTIQGANNTLKLEGQYYGYSSHNKKAEESSAIIINGGYTNLDLSTLESLVVAGTSFIKTSKEIVPEGSPKKTDIMMGDSIAVKGNQIAYLLPTECEGIVANPLDDDQRIALEANTNWQEIAKNTVLPSLGRSLASYGSLDIITYRPVDTARQGGATYLYIVFDDPQVASEYFMDYCAKTDTDKKLQSYLQEKYVTGFQFNTNSLSRIVTMGNHLESSKIDAKPIYSNTDIGKTVSVQELANYSNTYKALCINLVENLSAITNDQENLTVYQNTIDEEALDAFFRTCRTGGTLSSNMSFTQYSGYDVAEIWGIISDGEDTYNSVERVVLVDNAGRDTFDISTLSNRSGVIIATGNVLLSSVVQEAWKGLIICNGLATMDGGTSDHQIKLIADPAAVTKALLYTCSVGPQNYAASSFFDGGGDFAVTAPSTADGARVDVRDCLSYENWKSE